MKNSLKYFSLWQKKRSELQIDDDPQKDWLEMTALLDREMPDTTLDSDRPAGSKFIKSLSIMFISLSAAAMVYVAAHVVDLEKHKQTSFNYNRRAKTILNKDSISNSRITDSLSGKSPAISINDSSRTRNQPAFAKNAGQAKVGLSEKTTGAPLASAISNKNLAVSVHKNNSIRANGQNQNQATATGNGNRLVQASLAGNKSKFDKPSRIGKSGSSSTSLIKDASVKAGRQDISTNQTSVDDQSKESAADKFDNNTRYRPFFLTPAPTTDFNTLVKDEPGNTTATLSVRIIPNTVLAQLKDNKNANGKVKNPKTKKSNGKDSNPSNLDWGILTGVNSSGSFTPKNQNSNFYGPAPVDLFFGAFASYNLNAKWAINSQIKVLSPQNVSYNYTHFNNGMVDSPKLQINSARKIYSLEVPIQLSYSVNNYLSVVAGPLISIPVKQAGITNKLITNGSKQDSAYFAAVADTLNSTKYLQKLNFGLSGGVKFQFRRLSLGAMWNQNLTGYQINSAFGTYKTKPGTFQFTIGWQLDKINAK